MRAVRRSMRPMLTAASLFIGLAGLATVALAARAILRFPDNFNLVGAAVWSLLWGLVLVYAAWRVTRGGLASRRGALLAILAGVMSLFGVGGHPLGAVAAMVGAVLAIVAEATAPRA